MVSAELVVVSVFRAVEVFVESAGPLWPLVALVSFWRFGLLSELWHEVKAIPAVIKSRKMIFFMVDVYGLMVII